MPVDPKECRKHALFCTELAAAARTARSKALFLELSQSWEKLAIQLEDAIIENEDIRSYVRGCAPMATLSCDRGHHFEGRPKDIGGTFLQHAPDRTTVDRSGPQISFRFVASFRRQSAVISSNQANSLAAIP